MPYVTSLRGSVTHLATSPGRTRCSYEFVGAFYVSDKRPDRPLCGECARLADVHDRYVARRQSAVAARDGLLVDLLRDGLTDAAIRRHLHLSARSLSRYLNDAMRRAGARTRFQWGYVVGAAPDRAGE